MSRSKGAGSSKAKPAAKRKAATAGETLETLRIIPAPQPASVPEANLTADEKARSKKALDLASEIEKALATDSAENWSASMNALGIPAGPVLSVPDALDHPHTRARGLIKSFENVPGVDKPVQVVRAGFKLASGAPEPAIAPPALGQHTATIMEALGYSNADIEALEREGAIGVARLFQS